MYLPFCVFFTASACASVKERKFAFRFSRKLLHYYKTHFNPFQSDGPSNMSLAAETVIPPSWEDEG